MTDLRRLLDSSQNAALRSLLSSGLDDAPDPNALPKVAAALGVAAVTVTASSLVATSQATQAAVSAKSAALAGSTSTSAGALGFLGGNSVVALGKTLLVSVVSAGALSVGAVAVYEYTEPSGPSAAHLGRAGGIHAGSEQQPPRVRPQSSPAPAPPASAEPARAALGPEPASHAPAPPASGLQPGAAAVPAKPRPSMRPESPTDMVSQRTGILAREVRQIDSARQALASRNADGALAALDDYERSRVIGVLDREALLLKIEALTQKQDLDRAKVLARQYVERFPTDTHALRLRALLGSTSPNVQTLSGE